MYEMKDLNHYVLYIKDLNISEYIIREIKFLKELLGDIKVKNKFRIYIKETIKYFRKKT
jgi:hypothetical protein